jgi:hypothetical protein
MGRTSDAEGTVQAAFRRCAAPTVPARVGALRKIRS